MQFDAICGSGSRVYLKAPGYSRGAGLVICIVQRLSQRRSVPMRYRQAHRTGTADRIRHDSRFRGRKARAGRSWRSVAARRIATAAAQPLQLKVGDHVLRYAGQNREKSTAGAVGDAGRCAGGAGTRPRHVEESGFDAAARSRYQESSKDIDISGALEMSAEDIQFHDTTRALRVETGRRRQGHAVIWVSVCC